MLLQTVSMIKAQIVEEKEKGAIVIFADGSYLTEAGWGAEIALEDMSDSKSFGPPNGISNYEM